MKVEQIIADNVMEELEDGSTVVCVDFGNATDVNNVRVLNLNENKVDKALKLIKTENNLFFKTVEE